MGFKDKNLEPIVEIIKHTHNSYGQLMDTTSPLITSSINNKNRTEDIRRDLDKQDTFSIKLEDVDSAILTHLTDNISLYVMDGGIKTKVNVMYASPEKWKSIQKDGFVRDGQGKLQLPILAFGRNSLAKNLNLNTFNRYLTYPVVSKYNKLNAYNPINSLNKGDRGKTTEIFGVTLPNHVIITYACICQTEYVTQINEIIEKINFAANEYWGSKGRFKFRTYIENYTFTTENSDGEDRIVKAEFDLTVNAYLLPESFEDRKETIRRNLTPRRIKWGIEVVGGEPIRNNRKIQNTETTIVNTLGKSWQLKADESGGLFAQQINNTTTPVKSIEIISINGERWYLKVDEFGVPFLEKTP